MAALKISQRIIFDPDEMPRVLSNLWRGSNSKSVLAGINEDDCAIIKVGAQEIVISTDFLNANPIALEFKIGGFRDLGRLLVAANLSDLCGTGAKPVAFLSSIMLDKKTATKEKFLGLMAGVKFELDRHGIPLVGGDTKLGNSNCLCGIAVGIREKGTKLFLKNGAKAGDSIWVSGNIGSVGAAIDGLRNRTMRKDWRNWARNRIIRPSIPLQLSRVIAKTKAINSGTDLSDGLGADLNSLCEASNVGATIFAEKIPISRRVKEIAIKNKIHSWYYAFTVGGDFQFIVTSARKHDDALKEVGLVKIGMITRERKTIISTVDGIINMPGIGHRDANISSFSEELKEMILQLKSLEK